MSGFPRIDSRRRRIQMLFHSFSQPVDLLIHVPGSRSCLSGFAETRPVNQRDHGLRVIEQPVQIGAENLPVLADRAVGTMRQESSAGCSRCLCHWKLRHGFHNPGPGIGPKVRCPLTLRSCFSGSRVVCSDRYPRPYELPVLPSTPAGS